MFDYEGDDEDPQQDYKVSLTEYWTVLPMLWNSVFLSSKNTGTRLECCMKFNPSRRRALRMCSKVHITWKSPDAQWFQRRWWARTFCGVNCFESTLPAGTKPLDALKFTIRGGQRLVYFCSFFWPNQGQSLAFPLQLAFVSSPLSLLSFRALMSSLLLFNNNMSGRKRSAIWSRFQSI